MINISSYVDYLPSILWSQENDPSQLLGRVLGIYEKILTGTTINTQAIRARATIVNAAGNKIEVTDRTDVAKFRAGDIIIIEDTTERVRINHIQEREIFLDTNLTASYTGGTIRISDLLPGQTIFRVENATGLGQGYAVKITQGTKWEKKTIQSLNDNYITLSKELVNKYTMEITDLPVKIQDVGSIVHGTHEHDNFEKTIDELHQIFNPWHTDFLPWLASWVALTLQENWSEYQKRKLISQIASIYQERGLKKGLYAYLDIYAVAETKPRIAIDDGDAILRCTFLDNGAAILHTVVHTSAILGQDSMITALLHPSAIAADTNNDYIVVDQGNTSLSFYQDNTLLKSPQQPSLWKVSSTGEIEYKSTPNMPMPVPHPIYSGNPLVNPTAVVIKQNKYIVLDTGTFISETTANSAIYRIDSGIETIISKNTNPPSPAVYPVDMILDNSESFVVLDRGIYPTGELFSGSPSKNSGQKIIVVREGPLAVDEHRLKEVVEPTALAINSMGRFIVADAKNQSESDPADLVMVDPTAGWSEFSLLDSIPRDKNPLIFPTGLAFENPQTLLVCDTGVRLGFDEDEAYRTMAEPAAIYRITNLPQTPPASDLPQTPPTITRVTSERKLVNPTKMMIDRKGKLIITDKGEFIRSIGDIPSRNWRAKANEFGVAVYFSQQRPTTFDDRNRIRRGIENVVDEQKPGHVSWWMKS